MRWPEAPSNLMGSGGCVTLACCEGVRWEKRTKDAVAPVSTKIIEGTSSNKKDLYMWSGPSCFGRGRDGVAQTGDSGPIVSNSEKESDKEDVFEGEMCSGEGGRGGVVVRYESMLM
jgi:hypothetical protein